MKKLPLVAAVSLFAFATSAVVITSTRVAANGTVVEQDDSKPKSKRKRTTRGTSSGSHSGE